MKKFIVMILALLPLSMIAQELKLAVVNTDEVINAMPELSAMENEMEKVKNAYVNDLKRMNDEYEMKMADYINQRDTLPENISMGRVQELEGLRNRMEILNQSATQDLEKKHNDLLSPIIDKVRKAIEQVGEEFDYTIFDSRSVLAKGKGVVDATEKVKTKLGIK